MQACMHADSPCRDASCSAAAATVHQTLDDVCAPYRTLRATTRCPPQRGSNAPPRTRPPPAPPPRGRSSRSHQGISRAIKGHHGPSRVATGHQGSSRAITGHHGAIKGHHGPSRLITCTKIFSVASRSSAAPITWGRARSRPAPSRRSRAFGSPGAKWCLCTSCSNLRRARRLEVGTQRARAGHGQRAAQSRPCTSDAASGAVAG